MLKILDDIFFIWGGGVLGMLLSMVQDRKGIYTMFSTKKKIAMALIWPWYLVQNVYWWIRKRL